VLHAGDYTPTDFFEGAAMLITFILLGKFLEARASMQTTRRLTSLMSLVPETALLVQLSDTGAIVEEQEIDSRLIHIGDTLHVKPGAQVPADGVVLKVCINKKTIVNLISVSMRWNNCGPSLSMFTHKHGISMLLFLQAVHNDRSDGVWQEDTHERGARQSSVSVRGTVNRNADLASCLFRPYIRISSAAQTRTVPQSKLIPLQGKCAMIEAMAAHKSTPASEAPAVSLWAAPSTAATPSSAADRALSLTYRAY
jgi:hypothetical protein